MADLAASGSQISIHLTDRALIPIISSSRSNTSQSQSQAQALTSLTTAAITAYDSASRLDLGLPQRILVETSSSGPVILHSYLNPQSSQQPQSRHTRTINLNEREIVEQAREDLRPLSGTTEGSSVAGHRNEGADVVNGVVNGGDYSRGTDIGDGEQAEEEDGAVQQPPMLIASVIAASAGDTLEARRAAARLERMGREFQREFMRVQEESGESVTGEEDG
jgi:hypothetical protein